MRSRTVENNTEGRIRVYSFGLAGLQMIAELEPGARYTVAAENDYQPLLVESPAYLNSRVAVDIAKEE